MFIKPNQFIMKIQRLIITLLLIVVAAQATMADDIKVVGQNVENLFWNLDRTRTTQNGVPIANYNTEEGRTAKLTAIANALSSYQADIYAFNEVECNMEILYVLANYMSQFTGQTYQAVEDGLSYDLNTEPDGIIKSGYIYNTNKVKPYGSNTATGTGYIYERQMRMQTFESLASGERFTLSMNHFKAGDPATNGAARVNNSTSLLNSLPQSLDPDILVMGDLNSQMGEECLNMLVSADYEEQLLKYDSNPFSYVYLDTPELIDHVFANATMSAQVTDAKMLYVANPSSVGYNNAYSDHDPYLVTLSLKAQESTCENIHFSETFASSTGLFKSINNDASTNDWYHPSGKDYVQMSGYSKGGSNDDWFVSPAFNTIKKSTAAITFDHCMSYGTQSKWPSQMKLKASADYTGNPSAATWVEIPFTYPSYNSWTKVNVTLPDALMGKERINIAFHYTNPSKSDAPTWQVRNFTLDAECSSSAVQTVTQDFIIGSTRKVLENGKLIIVTPDGSRYNLQGIELQ